MDDKKKVTFGEWKEKHKTKTDGQHPPRLAVTRRSTGHVSAKPPETKTSKQRVSLPQTKNKQQLSTQTTKSLVRNCEKQPPACHVMKAHESRKVPDHMKTEEKQRSAQPSSRSFTEPKKHSTIKTSQEIRKISELDLEKAYKCVENLKLYDENLQKKVSLSTLNVAPDAKFYTDLVSVDVAEHQLGPRITDVRRHHTRDHRDCEPKPEDFQRKTIRTEDIWPCFAAISAPFNPVCIHDGKRVAQYVMQWQEKSANVVGKFGKQQ